MNCHGIVQVPDPVLRSECREVKEFGVALLSLAHDLIVSTKESGRVGVAAPQIGVSQRVFAVRDGIEYPKVYVNARILKSEGVQHGQEGCLSIKDRWFPCDRADYVLVEAQDVNGDPVTVEAIGLMARAFQHEIDHLDGTLFIDRVADQAKNLVRQQRRNIERQLAKVPA